MLVDQFNPFVLQISCIPLLAEQEILRLTTLCDKLSDGKTAALRELRGSRHDYESEIVRLKKEINDLTSTAELRHSSLLFERRDCKRKILDLETSVRDLSLRNDDLFVQNRDLSVQYESVRQELLQVKAKLCSGVVQESRLEREVKNLAGERQRLMSDLEYARQVIFENHEFALELEREHFKCKSCRKRYDPQRPCLFNNIV